jgi:hypothetical protein
VLPVFAYIKRKVGEIGDATMNIFLCPSAKKGNSYSVGRDLSWGLYEQISFQKAFRSPLPSS